MRIIWNNIFLKRTCLLSILILTISTYCKCSKVKVKGHLHKLGSHREPLGITWTGKFSTPEVFYQNFVDLGKPVKMVKALEHAKHPGLFNWTDGFLSKKFGSKIVKVEKSKIEDRYGTVSWIAFKDFLNTYRTEDIYLVHSLGKEMKDLALIPSTLQCGGFQKVIQEAVLWMGSHTTSSVLHRDPLDNLLCVMSGRKSVILIDKAYKKDIEDIGFDSVRGFSTVDPQRVDFDKFPRLAHVNWHEANLDQGDCLFIPQGWYHQVTSSGYRHLSANLWFSHLWWFNKTDCPFDIRDYKPLEPISKFGFASPNEAHRSKLLSHFKDGGILSRWVFHDLLPTNPTEERAEEFFDAINQFPDGAVTWSELYAFDIDKILLQFWDLFPGVVDTPSKKDKVDKIEDSIESDEEVTQVSEEHESSMTDSDNSHQESVEKDANVNDEGNVKDETSLPLPDAISGDAPSLPDDSINNPAHTSSIHEDEKENDMNKKMESEDEFCHSENDCGEGTPLSFHEFTESSSTSADSSLSGDQSSLQSDDIVETDSEDNEIILKDEL